MFKDINYFLEYIGNIKDVIYLPNDVLEKNSFALYLILKWKDFFDSEIDIEFISEIRNTNAKIFGNNLNNFNYVVGQFKNVDNNTISILYNFLIDKVIEYNNLRNIIQSETIIKIYENLNSREKYEELCEIIFSERLEPLGVKKANELLTKYPILVEYINWEKYLKKIKCLFFEVCLNNKHFPIIANGIYSKKYLATLFSKLDYDEVKYCLARTNFFNFDMDRNRYLSALFVEYMLGDSLVFRYDFDECFDRKEVLETFMRVYNKSQKELNKEIDREHFDLVIVSNIDL